MKKTLLWMASLLAVMTSCMSVKKQLTEEDMGAYLFVFFSDPTHSLFMATSYDGYTFTAVNDGHPVISGDTIAEQRGIRDPHITRGPDGAFYLAMTDLHIFGKQVGIRDTQWDRDGEAYGWGNNRGLVLMKSFDLINWTRSNVRLDKAYPEKFENAFQDAMTAPGIFNVNMAVNVALLAYEKENSGESGNPLPDYMMKSYVDKE